MWFGVLGPLEVFDDQGGPIAVSSAKQRVILALLLHRPNQPISLDRLLDLVWHGEPPRTARANVQVYVHRLRHALGESRIQHGPDGYRLVAAPEEIDAERFGQYVAAGRHHEALELWRGDAYVGLEDIDVLQDEAARLEELRLMSGEHRIEADLGQGRHAMVIAELQQLVARYPLREHLRGQLMLALYRCGRAAEATEVYRDGRASMVEELGLEPGPELRRLEQAILSDDPALEFDPSATASPPAVIPAELPATARWFTGRDAELSRIVTLLTESRQDGTVPIVAIDGPGGIGKSALALQAAHQAAGSFPDGQLYVNLQGATPGAEPLSAAEVLARFLRALGRTDAQIPRESAEAAASFRSITAGRRILLVLDDAADAAQVRPLLPGTAGPAVLVSSRSALVALDGVTTEHLEVLAEHEAVELLTRLTDQDRVQAQLPAATRIAQLCGRLPLAVRIAGARLAARPSWSLSSLADRLADNRARLDELEHADLAVRASFAIGHDALLADDARLLELIGWLGLPTITPPVATALADVPGPATLRSFDRLAEAQLVQEDADGRYSLHDLILLYTREQAAEHRSGAERAEALRRVLHWYVATARAGLRVLDPTSVHRHVVGVSTDELVQPGAELDSREQVVRWADAEHRNLLAVADLGVRAGQADLAAVVGLAAAAGRVFLFSGHTAAMAGINELLLDRAPGHPEAVAQAHTDLGVVYQETGRSALALDHLERGIAAWGRVGNRLSQAYALSGLGAALSRQGEFDRARIELNHAIEQHRSLGNADGENRALLNLGAVTFEQGRYDEAVGIFERCAELDAAGGDLSGYGISMQNLGITWQHLGDPDQAISHFDRAIDAYREAGDRPGEVSTLWECGELLHDIGDDTRARVYWTRAVSLMEELGRITADEAEAILAAPVPTKPANRH